MRTICKLLPLVILASAISLSSCVNEVKDPPKIQSNDTLSQLQIVYSIPDSNQVLTVHFHAVMTPPWQKNYRLDWNFGDSTGIISKFDTSNLTHYFQKYGLYLVTLSVFDTVSKTVLGKTSISLDIKDNSIDTNHLHKFTKLKISFRGQDRYYYFFQNFGKIVERQDSIIPTNQKTGPKDSALVWNGHNFTTSTNTNWTRSNPDPITGYIEQYSYSQEIRGNLSSNGRMIDSLTDVFTDYYYSNTLHTNDKHSDFTTVSVHSLPIFSIDQDSIVFSFTGASLQNKIVSLRNGYQGVVGGVGTIIDTLQSISWDIGNPALIVTFSK